MPNRPRARTEGVVSEGVDDDLVVYDQESHQAHCLSGPAASVWARCDGERTAEAIGRELALQPELVERALTELSRCGLLDEGPVTVRDYSRREAAVKFAKVGGAAITAPLIYSVVIASPAAAISCKQNGVVENGCAAANGKTVADSNCCSGHCYNGNSTGKICVKAGCTNAGLGCLLVGDCCSGACFLLFCVN